MNHDILETYTARGLLGTVIVRRLASRAQPLPEAVPDVFAALIRCALIRCADRGQVSESGSLDLDVQDELAPAAEMLRVETMFVCLTLQLGLFVTLMGYELPVPGGWNPQRRHPNPRRDPSSRPRRRRRRVAKQDRQLHPLHDAAPRWAPSPIALRPDAALAPAGPHPAAAATQASIVRSLSGFEQQIRILF